MPTSASELRRANYLASFGNEIKLGARARRAGILIEVRKAKGKSPLSRQYLAEALNASESTIKHDIEWLVKKGQLIHVRHLGNKGAIYKTARAQA